MWLFNVQKCPFRIEDYDRNSYFGRVDLVPDVAPYSMAVPPLTEFHDVTVTNCRGLQKSAASAFFEALDGSLSSGKRLYQDRFDPPKSFLVDHIVYNWHNCIEPVQKRISFGFLVCHISLDVM